MLSLEKVRRGSLSARRAWIEMNNAGIAGAACAVALRKESVDRNFYAGEIDDSARVALRKESVDRNVGRRLPVGGRRGSLSARRAWIEICYMILLH